MGLTDRSNKGIAAGAFARTDGVHGIASGLFADTGVRGETVVTKSKRRVTPPIRPARRVLPTGAALALAVFLGACTTASLEDAAPVASDLASPPAAATDLAGAGLPAEPAPGMPTPLVPPAAAFVEPDPPAPPAAELRETAVEGLSREEALAVARSRGTGPVDTGAFPNLNVAPVRHDERVSEEQEQATMELLRQRRAAVAGSGSAGADRAAAEAARLRQLGATRTQEVLDEIEGR